MRLRLLGVMLVTVALTPAAAWCQAAETDTGEFAGYGGGVFGLGSHGYVGASAGMAASRFALVLGDISFAPLGSATIRTRAPGESVKDSHLYDFNLSLHVRFPVGRKWVPYVIAGPSILWDNFRLARTGSNGAAFVSIDETNFGFHTGAGVRYHINEDWGIRPEVRVVISNRTYVVATVGVFWTFAE